MNVLKSPFFVGGLWLVVGGLWLVVWLLGFTNGNASPSFWMLPVALSSVILGITQVAQARR